ncbi:MAG: GntR family transcriptional regulator [Blastochloris sp.]|nr:GntR family transcriptional regulator [Blastochloris sp.]
MSNSGLASDQHGRDMRAHDLERLIEEQIRAGTYNEGARLPTVRELAQQYQINKNTASRAYQALERRGLIGMARGRGAFVRKAPAHSRDSWQQRAEQVIDDARSLGISRSQFMETLGQLIERVYGPAAPRVLFIECNQQDLETLGNELSAITATPMELKLLERALQAAPQLAGEYDLFVTTFQHLGQLRQAMPAAIRHQVVGVLVTPSHESLLDLARLHVATFGLVCDTPSTIESLTHIISTYNPAAVVLPTLIDDTEQVRRVMAQSDAIVVTRSCRQRLMDLGYNRPLVTVVFTIEQQSIDFLRGRLKELHAAVASGDS